MYAYRGRRMSHADNGTIGFKSLMITNEKILALFDFFRHRKGNIGLLLGLSILFFGQQTTSYFQNLSAVKEQAIENARQNIDYLSEEDAPIALKLENMESIEKFNKYLSKDTIYFRSLGIHDASGHNLFRYIKSNHPTDSLRFTFTMQDSAEGLFLVEDYIIYSKKIIDESEGKILGKALIAYSIEEKHKELNYSFLLTGTLFGCILILILITMIKSSYKIYRSEKELAKKNLMLKDSIGQIQTAQDQLIQSEKLSAIGLMVAGIAHEINTPKASISNYGIVLNRKISKIAKSEDWMFIKETCKNIEEEILPAIELCSERIGTIVDSLLNFTRIDHKEMQFSNISKIVEGVLIILKSQNRNQVLIVNNIDSSISFVCYRGQLSQVFMNIISNAIQAILMDNPERKDGVVKLNAEIINTNLIIRIQDNGPGMSESIRKKIFDPFFTTKPVGKGTGLGLSISYDIIKKHNGFIECRSEPGVGTEFIITIPDRRIHQTT